MSVKVLAFILDTFQLIKAKRKLDELFFNIYMSSENIFPLLPYVMTGIVASVLVRFLSL